MFEDMLDFNIFLIQKIKFDDMKITVQNYKIKR